MRYLLDTDTCVDLLRGVSAVVRKLEKIAPDDCCISTISRFELFAGAAGARNPRRETARIEKLLEFIEEAPFTDIAARRAGKLRVQLEQKGSPIGPYDLLIAAQTLTLNLVLVTANQREFGRISELQIESWR